MKEWKSESKIRREERKVQATQHIHKIGQTFCFHYFYWFFIGIEYDSFVKIIHQIIVVFDIGI